MVAVLKAAFSNERAANPDVYITGQNWYDIVYNNNKCKTAATLVTHESRPKSHLRKRVIRCLYCEYNGEEWHCNVIKWKCHFDGIFHTGFIWSGQKQYQVDNVIKWNMFRVTCPLRGESTGHRWIPLTKASEAELWCFLWSASEQTAEQTIKTSVI